MFRERLRLAGAFAALAIVAAGGGCQPGAQFSARDSNIINGVASTSEQDSAIALALFGSGGGFQGACSGVMILPDLVLTARHCVARTDQGALCDEEGMPIQGGVVRGNHQPEQLRVLVGPELSASLEFAATGKKIFNSSVDNLCNNDLALVLLDTAVPNAKTAKVRLKKPPAKDELITAVGWGQSNNSSGIGRRTRSDIAVTFVGPVFDVSVGGVGPNEFTTGEGICQGDSGGPAYAQETGAVIGVVSRGGNGKQPTQQNPTAPCVDDGQFITRNFFTRTDGFKDLILQAAAESQFEIWEEGGADPKLAKDGQPCKGNAECRSNICMSSACIPRCMGDALACDAGLECKDVDGQLGCVQPKPVKPAGGCSLAGAGATPRAWLLLALAPLALFRRRRA